MSPAFRRSPVKGQWRVFVWLGAFILCSSALVARIGWYWVGTIIGAYLMLAFASVLLKGRPGD